MNANDDSTLCIADGEDVHALFAKVRCPALVIHGDLDMCEPAERADILAKALGADQLTLTGAGHLPMAREPVAVNLAI
ncbi:MAG: alpha/beta hydrolase, partial [Actinomycetota bacterium]|nr:alpha/beta hydrolase [Actinomycetota bacterium]